MRFLVVGLAAYVLAAQVGTVQVVRRKVPVATVGSDLSVRLPIQPLPFGSRLAIVCRVRNDGDDTLQIVASVVGTPIATASNVGRANARLDFAVPNTAGELVLRGDRPWTLVEAEIATVHGFTRGVLTLFVQPAGQPTNRLSIGTMALFAVVTAPLVVVRSASIPAGLTSLHHVASVLVSALFTAIAASPLLTRYSVVLSPRSFGLACVLLLIPQIVTTAGMAIEKLNSVRWVAVGITGLVATFFFASAMLQELDRFDGNYSGFLHLSHAYAERLPFLRDRPGLAENLITHKDGYDGQFVWGMTFDPLLQRFRNEPTTYDAVADVPPYRYGRAGFSALVALVSLNDASSFARTQSWLVVIGHLLLACALAGFAIDRGWHPAVPLVYLAIPSFMPSLMAALPESLAAAGVAGGVLFWRRERHLWAAACFAASGLIRETGLLIPGCLILEALWKGRRHVAAVLSTAVGAAGLWRLYVWYRLSPVYGASAFYYNPGDLGWPFEGLVQLVRAGLSRSQPEPERLAAIVLPLVLVCLLAISVYWLLHRRDGLSLAAVGYGVVAVSLNYPKIWSHLPSGERGTYELFVCVLLLTMSDRRVSGKVLGWGALTLGAYTLFVSPSAAASRAALLLLD